MSYPEHDYSKGPNPMIISAGDDWRELPPELWGTRDRVQHARGERVRAEARALRPPEREFESLATGPVSDATAFQINPPRRPRRNARGKAIDALLWKHIGRR